MKPLFSLVCLCCCLVASQALAQAPKPTYPDRVYGTVGSRKLTLDIYIPTTGAKPYPLLVYIHGGGWFTGDKSSVFGYELTKEAVWHGFAVASVGYRLTSAPDQARFPAQIHDAKAAIRFLRDHASTYGYDGSRIGVFGTSAGGHLAALLGTSCGVQAAEGTIGASRSASSCVQAVVDFFGPTDLLNMNLHITNPPGSDIDHDAPNSPESALIGWSKGIGDLRKNLNNTTSPYPTYVARARLANPISHIDPSDPPFFIAHGNQDRLVPLKQSKLLADALKRVGVSVEYYEVPGKGHGDVGTPIEYKALAFLQRVLAKPKPEPSPEPPPRAEPPPPEPPRPEPPIGNEPPVTEPPPQREPPTRPEPPGPEPSVERITPDGSTAPDRTASPDLPVPPVEPALRPDAGTPEQAAPSADSEGSNPRRQPGCVCDQSSSPQLSWLLLLLCCALVLLRPKHRSPR